MTVGPSNWMAATANKMQPNQRAEQMGRMQRVLSRLSAPIQALFAEANQPTIRTKRGPQCSGYGRYWTKHCYPHLHTSVSLHGLCQPPLHPNGKSLPLVLGVAYRHVIRVLQPMHLACNWKQRSPRKLQAPMPWKQAGISTKTQLRECHRAGT